MISKICFQDCKLIGKGAEGNVYISPEGYAVKCFRTIKAADHEAEILKIVHGSRFFPQLLLQVSNVVVRQFAQGINLYEYILTKGLSYNLAVEIIEFVEDMKKYNFNRINIRNAHIFISAEEKLMVIDPRKPFDKETPYPKDIIKILLKHRIFEEFLEHVSNYDNKLTSYWIKGYHFVADTNKVSRYG